MKKIILILLSVFTFSHALENSYYADDFMNIEWNARSSALGGADIVSKGNISSLYYNPSGLSIVKQKQISLTHASMFNGEVNSDIISCALMLDSCVGFGLGYARIGMDNIKDTRGFEIDDNGTPVYDLSKLSYLSVLDQLLYTGIGKEFYGKYSVGLSMKIYYRNLGDITGYGFSTDLGFIWDINKNFNAGFSVNNLSTAYTRWNTSSKVYSESAYPNTYIGLSYKKPTPYFYGNFSIFFKSASLYSFNAINSSKEKTPTNYIFYKNFSGWAKGSFIALEYTFKKTLFFRGSYNAIYDYTLGGGFNLNEKNLKNKTLLNLIHKLNVNSIGVDYAFLQNSQLGKSPIISAIIKF